MTEATLSIGQVGTHVFNGAIYSLGYDVLKDFAPIALVASNPQLIDAREDFPANDLKELRAWLKANPDKALQGTAGAGSPAHIVGSYFQRVTGTAFRFVPYRGAAPAMQALVGPPDRSHVRPGRQFVAAGEGRSHQAFAVTAKTRLAAGPEIPTVDEAGLPGFYTAIWHGLWAPKGTAADVIAVLNGAVREALADRMVQRRLAELGQELPPGDQ